MTRAPKGGTTVQGVFYKGGQFLPTNEPQRGKFNSNKATAKKARKVEIAPYEWVYPENENQRPLYTKLNGTFAKFTNGKMEYAGNEKILAYVGLTEAQARDMITKFNSGQRWI